MIDAEIIVYGLVSLVIAISLHEMMHAYVGYLLGDDTAHSHGRITINPLAHIDPVMTIVVPLLLLASGLLPIAAAKPVPFNPSRLRFGEIGAGLVAIAGPLTNLTLAFAGGILYGVIGGQYVDFFATFIAVNVGLFVFNMLPIPPLDGSRVLYVIAPDSVRNVMNAIESAGIVVIFILLLFGGGFLTPILTTTNEFILGLVVDTINAV